MEEFYEYFIRISKIDCISPVICKYNPRVTEYGFSFQIDGIMYSINRFGEDALKEAELIRKELIFICKK